MMAALPVDDADKFQQWLLEEYSDNGETVMMAPGGSMYATPGKQKRGPHGLRPRKRQARARHGNSQEGH